MIEVYLVDNDRFASAGLRQHLDEDSDIRIVGSADSGEMALEMLEELGGQLPQMILARARLPGLTGIQVAIEILERGLTNQGIAQELGLKKRTIDFQIERNLETLNAKNRAEASAIARRRGWLR